MKITLAKTIGIAHWGLSALTIVKMNTITKVNMDNNISVALVSKARKSERYEVEKAGKWLGTVWEEKIT
jgi:hypothetical protein